jgi:hypothetical protein
MSTTDEPKQPQFQASIEARLMADRFSKAQIGEIVTYDELSKIVGQDVRGQHMRSRLHTAIRNTLRDHRAVFGVVATVGYKRLADDELPKLGEASIAKIGRESRRTLKKMGAADFSKMSRAGLSEWNANASHLGLLSEVTKPRVAKAITAATEKAQQQLPTAKAIEAAFSNGK